MNKILLCLALLTVFFKSQFAFEIPLVCDSIGGEASVYKNGVEWDCAVPLPWETGAGK